MLHLQVKPRLPHWPPSPIHSDCNYAIIGHWAEFELQIQRIIEREVQNAVKAMDAMLPTIAPHFTVSSPSSVASANGTTNETVVIPRPDLTNNTATSDPSTVALSTSHLATNIMSQPQSSTVSFRCTRIQIG